LFYIKTNIQAKEPFNPLILMKNHFVSLFNPENRKKTIIFSIIAALLISVSLITGISDNLPMIAMCFAGLVFLYFALLHPWGKVSYFAILTATCIVIIVLDFIWPFINEDVAMTVGFVCLAGVISGIIGIFSRIKNWQRLPIAGSLLSLVALGVFSTNLGNPLKELIAPISEWMLIIGIQLFVAILLFSIGLINKRERLLTKVMLVVAAIVLILLSIWGFYASTWQIGEAVHSVAFAVMTFRLFASIEIIVASLSLYACK
jgi:hypothetical protein